MPKNSADPKKDRSNNRADKKNSQRNQAHFTEEPLMASNQKSANYVPSLNGVTKNET